MEELSFFEVSSTLNRLNPNSGPNELALTQIFKLSSIPNMSNLKHGWIKLFLHFRI